jgi:hypothetical protein
MAVVVVGGVGKDALVAAAINCPRSQQRHHWRRQLNPTAATIDNNRYRCRRQSPSLLPHSRQQQPPEASDCCLSSMAAMAVIVDRSGSQYQPRQ